MTTQHTNTIRIKASNIEQIKSFAKSKTILSALLGAGGALGFVSAKNILNDNAAATAESAFTELNLPGPNLERNHLSSEEYVEIETSETIRTSDHSMSFSDAFAEHREALGPGGIFEYNGNLYNTYYKEEWLNLGSDGQSEYFANLDKTANHSSAIINSNGNITKINLDNDPEVEFILKDNNFDGTFDEIEITTDNDLFINTEHSTESIDLDSRPLKQEPTSETLSIANNQKIEENNNLEDSLESILLEPGDLIDPNNDYEEDLLDMSEGNFSFDEDIPEPESSVVLDVIQDGDLTEPIMLEGKDFDEPLELEEGDLFDPSDLGDVEIESEIIEPSTKGINPIEQDDLNENDSEQLDNYFEEDDLLDPSNDSNNELPNIADDFTSEFDF